MNRQVTCRCCSLPIPITSDDLGRSVNCPRSGQSVRVPAGLAPPTTRALNGLRAAAAPPLKAELASQGPSDRPARQRRRTRSQTRSLSPSAKALIAIGVVALFVAGFAAQRLVQRKQAVLEPEVVASTTLSSVGDRPTLPNDPPRSISTPPPSPPVAASPVSPPAGPVAVAPPPRPLISTGNQERKVGQTPVVAALTPGDRALLLHSLPKRIDTRTGDQLERDLLGMREIALDTTGSNKMATELVKTARTRNARGIQEPLVVQACRNRSELAHLPFLLGPDSVLPRDRATAMDTLSKELRTVLQQSCDPRTLRPDARQLFSILSTGQDKAGNSGRKVWATTDAIPCINQMLQAEGGPVRRVSCEMLRSMPGRASTETLVRWAVFDTDPDNRAAAVDALRSRDRAEVATLFTPFIRYPWPRAVEHACEALVRLGCTEAIPSLAAAFDEPDPDAPFKVTLPGLKDRTFRREVVRVNHLRNCLLCHAPSFESTDLIRASVPDLTRDPPSSEPSGYSGQTGPFIAAEITYLRQDFSVVQPVVNPGKWPIRQRYDYMIAIRRSDGLEGGRPGLESPYRRAIAFALEELSGIDPDRDQNWVQKGKAIAGPVDLGRTGEVARMLVMATNPTPLVALKHQDATTSLLRQSGAELSKRIWEMQHEHGATAVRLALIAYLDPLTRDLDQSVATRASHMLGMAAGPLSDAELSEGLRVAAKAWE